jgi:nucleoside-diphosphate-sugar epimerase
MNVHPVLADITRPETLPASPGRYDWVVHCVSSSKGDSDAYRQVYLRGTRNLLEWLEPSPPRKFVYTGSTGVYRQTDGSLVDETSPTDPGADTTQILLETEELLLEAARGKGFPAVVLRVAGIYGPGRGYWLTQYLKGEAKVEGRGERILNMIHRDDVAGAVLAALIAGRPGEIYDAVDNEPVSQLMLFQWLSQKLGRDLPPFTAEGAGNRKRGVTNKRVSNRKLREELAYEFIYPTFREGFEQELKNRP